MVIPDRVASYLIATHRTHRPDAQAAALGVCLDTVWRYKALLYRAGLLRREDRATMRPRTASEVQRAVQLARQGMLGREIAEALGRTEHDVSEWLAPYGGLYTLRAAGGDAWLSLQACAQLLGVHTSAVRRWVEAGAIVAGRTKDAPKGRKRRNPGVKGGFYQITRAALCDFLRDRRWWMEYTPSTIADADLRRLSTVVRHAANGRWEKLRPFAGRCSSGAYARWRGCGWPGPAWEVVRSGTVDMVWLPQGTAPPVPPRRWMARSAVLRQVGVRDEL